MLSTDTLLSEQVLKKHFFYQKEKKKTILETIPKEALKFYFIFILNLKATCFET